ncbi:AAA family ATPase [Clostridium perfringens]|nr:AAA family ATPase [Clostridium perfringens]
MSKLKVKKLVVLGCDYKRTLEFSDGLTIISGEKTSGKSLVLSLIDYCLGKSENIKLNVQKQLNEHCDQVLLEVDINNEKIIFKRNLKRNQKKISIYFCSLEKIHEYTPKVVDIQEAMSIIMRKLKINEYRKPKNKAHSNEQILEIISFRDIFRYVYVNQHMLGTDDFLNNKSTFKKYKNPYAFELIFNLIEQDKEQLNYQLVNAKNKLDKINKEVLGLKSYLEDKEAEDLSLLVAEVKNLNNNINKQLKEKKLIIENSNNTSTENQMYINLKNRLIDIENRKSDFEKRKDEISISISSKKLLLNEYSKEKKDIEATLEANYKLTLDSQIIECPLCSSKVHSKIQNCNKQSQDVLINIKKDIDSKVKLVNSLIDKDLNEIKDIDSKIMSLNNEQVVYSKAINEFSKKTSVPYLSQIDSINNIINSYTKNLESINECIRLHNKINEKNKFITELEDEIEILEEKIKKLKIDEDNKSRIFDVLNDKYKEYMKRFKYDVSNTYIDKNNYTPYHDGASIFEHESGGLLECMQIAFLCSIIASKDYGYAQGHPGFILMDTISKYIGTVISDENPEEDIKNKIDDPEIYEEIYKIFLELSNKYQFIIVENTPPVKYNKYAKYTFLAGEEGLINLDLNELKLEE